MDKQSKILIIDDDIDLIEAMKITLESKNYQILTAYNPEEGFQVAKSENPNLIILDVMFGSEEKSSGFDYAVKMKQDKTMAAIPILMSSAVNQAHPDFGFSAETDAEFLPVDDFINKPAQPIDLLERIERLLKQKISMWVNYPEKTSINK
jgi:DNA-binding response OmpR family regulator